MLKSSARSAIRLRGVRHNNLKNFDLDLPLNQLIVITGLSGSGKSSLAFDTLFAEGQRRYIETFSPYARQFFDRMDKPQVDSIEGIPPAVAIEQVNAVKSSRSTVGTMTEVCDYMKMLWPHVAQLHCRQCGQPVRKDTPQQIWQTLLPHHALVAPMSDEGGSRITEFLITFDLPLSDKLSLDDSLALISKQGYQRLLLDGQIARLDEATSAVKPHALRTTSLTVIQDRLRLADANRARFVEACEQAYHFGKGKLAIHRLADDTADSKLKIQHSRPFSNRVHCAQCDIEYHDPSPALFSFNHPVGACPTCRGFGRVISIDYDLAIPDRSKTLAQGLVKPWQSGMSAECQSDLLRMCRHFRIPTDVPFEKLPKKWQSFVIEGEPDYGKDDEHEWPRAWYGLKGYFRWLESKAYKMHVRVLLSRYRAYTPCPDCKGKRFQPEALLYRQDSLTLADFYQMPIRDALPFIEGLAAKQRSRANDPLVVVLNEIRSRLGYLDQVGLGYLTLDRPTRSLSGGETERVNLTTCLGTRLVNTLFVLDEPSVGLHPRDTERLVRILEQLRDAGNTVVVVEHEASVMRAANQIIDLGPGHGATGGQVVFQGTYAGILASKDSLTGQYLSGVKTIELPPRRPVSVGRASRLSASYRGEFKNTLHRPKKCGETPKAFGVDATLPPGSTQLKQGVNERRSRFLNAPRPSSWDAGFVKDPLYLNDAPVSMGRWDACPTLTLAHATRHNLKDLSVEIPLGRFVCVTGVSGSGKTTLLREVLMPALTTKLKSALPGGRDSDRFPAEEDGDDPSSDSSPATLNWPLLTGWQRLDRVVLVDQSILAKTPRSNPAVYIGAFDDIREFFAQSDPAKQRGLSASAFSFNSSQGQCERCRGAGFEKIEMQFLSDVFIRCPDCNGRRYRAHILEVKISPQAAVQSPKSKVQSPPRARSALSIADLLESTVEEAIEFLAGFPESRPAQRAVEALKLLGEVGLGYLKLGQPINTLSGGESQRLKLVRHLAEVVVTADARRLTSTKNAECGMRKKDLPDASGTSAATLFLFDEPTTGLHFDDVRVLLKIFQRLVNAGHSVLVIEHNLDVIKSADWIIDLGPEAGDQGGQLVAQGTPEEIAACPQSHTGRALREVLRPEVDRHLTLSG